MPDLELNGLYSNGTLHAVLADENWVCCEWLNPAGRLVPSLIRGIRYIESLCKEKGWPGWVCGSEEDHTIFHSLLIKFGAMPFLKENHQIYFRKVL